MFCPNCGKQLNENEKFCSECGTQTNINAVTDVNPSVQTEPANTTIVNQEPKKKKKKGVFILLAIVAAIVLFIAFVSDDGDDKDVTDADITTNNVEVVDDKILLKLPTYFMLDEEYNDWLEKVDSDEYNGNLEVTEDYVIITMDNDKHNELKTMFVDYTDDQFNDYVSSGSYETVKDIAYSDDFKKATITVSSKYLDSDDSLLVRKVGDGLSQIRAMFFGDYSAKIEITIKYENGNIVDTVKYMHPTTRAIEVTAEELLDAYATNEVAAKKKYENKYICITGIVESIGEDITDTLYITLSSGDEWDFGNVQCYFSDEYLNEIATLNKGDKVTVYGTHSDYFMSVLIEDCVLWVN